MQPVINWSQDCKSLRNLSSNNVRPAKCHSETGLRGNCGTAVREPEWGDTHSSWEAFEASKGLPVSQLAAQKSLEMHIIKKEKKKKKKGKKKEKKRKELHSLNIFETALSHLGIVFIVANVLKINEI